MTAKDEIGSVAGGWLIWFDEASISTRQIAARQGSYTMVIQFPHEPQSNAARLVIAEHEAVAARTFTPSQAVLARSAGIYHWTPEGRRLYDFTSGVLVANLGHNPLNWSRRWAHYLGWQPADLFANAGPATDTAAGGGRLESFQAAPGLMH